MARSIPQQPGPGLSFAKATPISSPSLFCCLNEKNIMEISGTRWQQHFDSIRPTTNNHTRPTLHMKVDGAAGPLIIIDAEEQQKGKVMEHIRTEKRGGSV
jgi:hypothetical protein